MKFASDTEATVTVQRMLIDGQEPEAVSGDTLPVLNPATGHLLARVPAGEATDVDMAVAAAKAAFETGPWPRLDRHERATIIHRFANLLEAHLEELFRLETLNNGRPVIETRAQLSRLPEWYRYNASLLLAQREDVVPFKGDYVTYLQRSPLGVCGLLTPFNHPMQILAKSLAPALATGNTVVIKPSELTPLTTLELGRLAAAAGIPDGVINIVTGLGSTAGAALAEHPDVAKLTFTGGTEVGRSIAVAAARRFAPSVTELGGKSPVIIFDDVDLDRAVNGAAFAGFVAAGQTCIAGTRLFVQQDIYDEFSRRLVDKARSLRIGDPASELTQLGPLVAERQRKRVLDYIALGIQEGAVLACGGEVPALAAPLDGGFFVEPTVFVQANNRMRIAREEIFGPVLCVIPFTDEADAITQANDSPYGLGSSVWTQDGARGHRVAQQIDAGVTWINDHHRIDPAMPWGGFKESGHGKEGGTESFNDFSEVKAIVVNIGGDTPDWYGSQPPNRLN